MTGSLIPKREQRLLGNDSTYYRPEPPNTLQKSLPSTPSRYDGGLILWMRTLKHQHIWEITLKITQLVGNGARIQSLAAQLPRPFPWLPLGQRSGGWKTGISSEQQVRSVTNWQPEVKVSS